MRHSRSYLFALAILTVAVYARSLSYGFVYEDIHSGPAGGWLPFAFVWPNHLDSALSTSWGLWPFAIATWICHSAPWADHALVIGLHLINGCLLWLLLAPFLSERMRLVVIGLFWLHPLQVESVAYVTGGRETLVAAYLLFALWLTRDDGAWRWTLALSSLALAATTKASALQVLVLFPLGLFGLRGGWPPEWFAQPAWTVQGQAQRQAVGLVASVAMVIAIILGPSMAQLIAAHMTDATISERLTYLGLTAFASGRYALTTIWPVLRFTVDHDWATVPNWACIGAGVVFVALFTRACMAHLSVESRVAWLWCLVPIMLRMLVPVDPVLTEHHLYLPWMAVWIGVPLLIRRLVDITGLAADEDPAVYQMRAFYGR